MAHCEGDSSSPDILDFQAQASPRPWVEGETGRRLVDLSKEELLYCKEDAL